MKMRKTLSNIVALAVLIVGILFFGSVFTVMLFSLAVFVKMNVWLAVAISASTVLLGAYVYGCLAKKLGVKMEL
ncbi:hypothetical protein E3J49_01935 [Candidatus Bathyarchaeota archaeon]|nr:hypothetical protein [Candidatus Bathyarchaeota archaeon]TET65342.1 MAG: hypothetical protein E3J49_01935 [Candidatus Bathyarchaeota archaeon]